MIRATFGQRGSGSGASAALTSSLVSRLKQRLPLGGTTVFAMTWKQKTTPSGRLLSRLAASARSTSVNASGGSLNVESPWATPSAEEQSEAPETKTARNERHRAAGKMKGVGSFKLGTQALTVETGWATPAAEEAGGSPDQFLTRKAKAKAKGHNIGISLTSLSLQADTVGSAWPTPTKQDAASSAAMNYPPSETRHTGTTLTDAASLASSRTTPQATDAGNPYGSKNSQYSMLPNEAQMVTAWPSPRGADGDSGTSSIHGQGGMDLRMTASLMTPWASPAARDWKDSPGMAETGTNPDGSERTRLDQLPRQANLVVSAWPTPNTPSGGRSRSIEKMDATGLTLDGKKHTASLEHAVKFAANWPTPMAGSPATETYNEAGQTMNGLKTVELVRGTTSNGSHAETGKRGQLNPAFSLWLMGYEPVTWCLAAPSNAQRPSFPKKTQPTNSTGRTRSEGQATRSSPTSPPKS